MKRGERGASFTPFQAPGRAVAGDQSRHHCAIAQTPESQIYESISMKHQRVPLIGGKTIDEWDQLWVPVPNGLRQHQSHLTEAVGLYRYILNRQTMALGTGTDSKGGIAKRLSDMIRPSWSGRDHHLGKLVYDNRRRLAVEVLLTGSGHEAQAIARKLKVPMVNLHQPSWNVRITSSPAPVRTTAPDGREAAAQLTQASA